MIDFDLDHLGDVWRQRPDSAELERLKRAAEAVRRRAQWAQVVDIASAIVVGGVVLLLVLSNPRSDTLLIGGAAIAVLLGSHLRQRQLRSLELRSLAGSAEEMLDQLIARVRGNVKRARYGLFILGPCIIVGYSLARAADYNFGQGGFLKAAVDPTIRMLFLPMAALALAVGMVHLISSLRRNGRELERLLALRQSYREDQEPDSEA